MTTHLLSVAVAVVWGLFVLMAVIICVSRWAWGEYVRFYRSIP